MTVANIPSGQYGLQGRSWSSGYTDQLAAIGHDSRYGVGIMANRQSVVPLDIFKWIVGGLLGVLMVLTGLIYTTLRSDLGDVQTKLDGMTREMHESRVEIVKAISTLTGKFDQFSQDMRRR
jgi:hypothetical protein